MKNTSLKHILFVAIAGTVLVATVDAQQREKPRGGRQIGGQSNQAAPNSLRNQSQSQGQQNRQTARKPFGSANQGRGDSARKPQQGGRNKPQTGMTRGPKPGQQKPNLRETLNLTEEQAKAFHAARKKWSELAKSIQENKALSKEEKQAKVMEGYKRLDAKVREILSEKQYSQLRELRRRNARPSNQNAQGRPQQGGGQQQGRPQGRPQPKNR